MNILQTLHPRAALKSKELPMDYIYNTYIFTLNCTYFTNGSGVCRSLGRRVGPSKYIPGSAWIVVQRRFRTGWMLLIGERETTSLNPWRKSKMDWCPK